MADHNKIGTEYPEQVWEIERGKIRELAKAIGDPNPIYYDRDAAIAEGYKDTPIPPTFLTIPTMWCGLMPVVINDLKINYMMALHGEEEYEYYLPICSGDVIRAIPKVASIDEKITKSGNKMDRVIVEILYKNQRDEIVAKAKSLLIERK